MFTILMLFHYLCFSWICVYFNEILIIISNGSIHLKELCIFLNPLFVLCCHFCLCTVINFRPYLSRLFRFYFIRCFLFFSTNVFIFIYSNMRQREKVISLFFHSLYFCNNLFVSIVCLLLIYLSINNNRYVFGRIRADLLMAAKFNEKLSNF